MPQLPDTPTPHGGPAGVPANVGTIAAGVLARVRSQPLTFTVNTLTRCTGGNHWHLALTIAGQSQTVRLTKEDVELEPSELREAMISRVRSAVKEANATTFAQAKAALEGKEFKV